MYIVQACQGASWAYIDISIASIEALVMIPLRQRTRSANARWGSSTLYLALHAYKVAIADSTCDPTLILYFCHVQNHFPATTPQNLRTALFLT